MADRQHYLNEETIDVVKIEGMDDEMTSPIVLEDQLDFSITHSAELRRELLN